MPDSNAVDGELNFLELLQGFRRGRLLGEASEKLDELMEAVGATGGSGKLTLELPFKFNKAGQLECNPVVKLSKPTAPVGTGIYFLTPENRLSRRDPRQTDIEDHLQERREQRGA